MVQVVLMLSAVALTPFAGLLLLLWLDHFEDTLARDVESARRRPAPPPVRAIPVRATRPVLTVVPQPQPQPQPVGAEQVSARSALSA